MKCPQRTGKNFFLPTILILFFFCPLYSLAQSYTGDSSYQQHIDFLNKRIDASAVSAENAAYVNGQDYDAKYYRCEWRVNPDSTLYIRGKVTMYFQTLSNAINVIPINDMILLLYIFPLLNNLLYKFYCFTHHQKGLKL